MGKMRFRFAEFSVLLFFLMTVTGVCGQPAGTAAAKPDDAWKAVQERARKEGRVVLYTQVVPAVLARIKADFDKAVPGVVLEPVRLTGSTVMLRPEQERKSGADGGDVVIMVDTAWLDDRDKEGALIAPSGPELKTWPTSYLRGKTMPILAVEPFVIVYNRSQVKTAITGYQDLLKAELKGKVGTLEIQSATAAAWYDWLEKTQGPDFLKKLSAQTSRFDGSAVPSTQAVSAGEISAIAFSIMSIAGPLIEQGAPVTAVVPKPSLGLAYNGAILGWSKRPNAALVFMDYLMSRRGQTMWHGRGETASPIKDIPGSLEAATVNTFDSRPYTADVVNAAREKWRRMFATK